MKKRWYLTIPLAAALLLGGLAVSRISRSPSLEEQIVEAVGYPEALTLAEDLTFFETVQAGSITVRGFIHPLESSYCGVALLDTESGRLLAAWDRGSLLRRADRVSFESFFSDGHHYYIFLSTNEDLAEIRWQDAGGLRSFPASGAPDLILVPCSDAKEGAVYAFYDRAGNPIGM